MTTNRFVALTFAVLICTASARSAVGDTFGSGANTFDIEFVTIGNPGNVADTTGNPNPAGSVPHTYRMGKFEISRSMVARANDEGSLGLTLAGPLFTSLAGSNKPATDVSWNEAARFVNWLNTSVGSSPAYKFAVQPGEAGYNVNADIELWTISDPGYNPANLYRNSLATYVLPSVDEWYKAAYYDPSASVYWNYPTGSNAAPTITSSGMSAGTAVFGGLDGPADITLAGGPSPYGTVGQGGNVWEYEETDYDLLNGVGSLNRGNRGGSWRSLSGFLHARARDSFPASDTIVSHGFRVASIAIPEPSTLLLGALASMGLLWRRRVRTSPQRGAR